MAEGIDKKPLLNPVLSLLKEPTPATISAGGKSRASIVQARLEAQRESLSSSFAEMNEKRDQIVTHAKKTHLIARMFKDSNAPSWTPNDLFDSSYGCRIIAPAHEGYLIEADVERFQLMASRIKKAKTIVNEVDISRIQSVSLFDASETLRRKSAEEIWKKNDESNRFIVWLMPFSDTTAKKSVYEKVLELYKAEVIKIDDNLFSNPFEIETDNVRLSPDGKLVPPILVRTLNRYLTEGTATFSVVLESPSALQALAGSGAAYRIDPISPIRVNSSPPGSGREPTPPKSASNLPVVLIVDGGRTAKSYQPCEVFRHEELVKDGVADHDHGNQITSLVCQGHAWNNNLVLPELNCAFVVAQAITKPGMPQPSPQTFIEYLEGVASRNTHGAKVWNLSFNEIMPNSSQSEISYLGHEINKIARKHGILPVISIGNVSPDNASILCPPADCESAITVSGRNADASGMPDIACKFSLRGPAPAGMKKPDLAWFSNLRMIGGNTKVGTSYATTLVSSLAAHTFANLKSPTPDLVRALLINSADREEHCESLGWGSPCSAESEPWLCKEGTVTLAWTSKIRPGFAYYWNEIPVPPEMIVNGKLCGRATLTAILKPETSKLAGPNYFSTRLEVSLQAKSPDGKNTVSLLGSMKESSESEMEARTELSKWSPIRRHCNRFKRKSIDFKSMRLYARVFGRDLYQFDLNDHHGLPDQEISFVLTFESNNPNSDIYSSMTSSLGGFVQSAVIEQKVELLVGSDE
ncbi:S8 family serine peptidase [Pseudomonas oryzihabitans]|uniref:Peptidase S8/S53 domain-containing protein n=1 Tax=Pseudomonas oryzihabitans TaxID=47885 RepID=A0AAJ2EX00_9PSED|nr:S8 family serine peptidase [Pseudomonas psychrotolerans]MDR6235318.1 hypothetical protein [Pseudomonas psychrotolerans]MDR6355452.1 hypothetical protein [Pseudomonas psychrotolerans]